MTARSRLLLAGGENSPPPSIQPAVVNSDFVLILAALLCALISVLGLLTVVRCAWIQRMCGRTSISVPEEASPPPSAVANKGLKKKVLKSLPSMKYEKQKLSSDCAICLSEFAAGEEIRVLPQCGHGFHIECIDMWLGSHSSCPSCRQILVVSRCQKCGEAKKSGGPPAEASQNNHVDQFLP